MGAAYVDAVVNNVDALGTGVPGTDTPSNAPRWTGNAMARYTWPAFRRTSVRAGRRQLPQQVLVRRRDVPTSSTGSYGLVNLRLNYLTHSEKIEVGASLENAADKHYATMGFDNTGVNNLAQSYPGMPRWFKLHINYKFGGDTSHQ